MITHITLVFKSISGISRNKLHCRNFLTCPNANVTLSLQQKLFHRPATSRMTSHYDRDHSNDSNAERKAIRIKLDPRKWHASFLRMLAKYLSKMRIFVQKLLSVLQSYLFLYIFCIWYLMHLLHLFDMIGRIATYL